MPVPRLDVPVQPAPSWPAALRLLLGEAACDLWPDVLPGRLDGLAVSGVTLQPDGAATVRYTAAVTRPDGRETRESLTATTGSRIPDGATTVEAVVDGRAPHRRASGGGPTTRPSRRSSGRPRHPASLRVWRNSG